MQHRIDRPGLAQHADDAADEKDQEDNPLRRLQPVGYREQEVPWRQRLGGIALEHLVGTLDDDHAPGLVGDRHPVESAVGYHVGKQLRQQDERADQDQGVDRPVALAHAQSALCLRGRSPAA